MGHTTQYQYDANGNLYCLIDANEHNDTADPSYQPLNANGCSEWRGYDELNRQTQSKNAQNCANLEHQHVSIIGFSALEYHWLYESQRQKDDDYALAAHEPADGWIKLLDGIKPYEAVNLAGHSCGCKAECTVKAVFANGIPKRWEVQVFHDDGSLALDRLSYRALPLLTASQYLAFCTKNLIPFFENMPLAGWLGDFEIKGLRAKSNPTCGGKAINKLIDRAFYLESVDN